MNKSRGIILIITAVAMVIPAAHGFAQENGWKFSVAPYAWLAAIDGHITADGSQSSVDVSFSDILDVLDFGGAVHIEAEKNKWGVFVDPTYMKISADEHVDPASVEIDAEMWLVEIGGVYGLGEWHVGSNKSRRLALDVLGGGRYWSLETEIDIGIPIAGITFDAKDTVNWIDPFIGFRIRTNLTEKLLFNVRGDVGGFDIGDSSHLTWNVLAAFGYGFTERTSLWLGYRALNVDYEEGSGADLFEFDVTMSGPIVGVYLRF
jgi:hypothetical protein